MSVTPAAETAIIVIVLFSLVAFIAWFFKTQIAVFAKALVGARPKADNVEGQPETELQQREGEEGQSDQRAAGAQMTSS